MSATETVKPADLSTYSSAEIAARLESLGEWMGLGFHSGRDLPWPRAYGLAWRRLYENMAVRIPPTGWLIPAEPFPVRRDMNSHRDWYATGLICDFDHNRGLRLNASIAAEKKLEHPDQAAFIDAWLADFGPRLPHFGGYTHSNPDIRRVVSEGFDIMQAEIAAELAAVQAAGQQADPGELQLLLALTDYAAGVRAFHDRTVAALTAAAAAAAGARARELEFIRDNLRTAFRRPAETFYQGLLAVHFAWLLDGCDSLGRVDQALGGLLERDLAAGRIEIDFARQLLDELFAQFERFNGWNLQIGGYTPEGEDGCNRLTAEIIAACGRKRWRRPNVAFRLTRQTPPELLDAALTILAAGSGRPALYNDDLYVQTLQELDLGLTLEDAREIGFGGCTETMVAGLSNVGSLEGNLNLAKALELALHDGIDPLTGRRAGPATGSFPDFATYAAFQAAVEKQIAHLTREFCDWADEQLRRRFTAGDPKLYRTCFTRDCVRNRKSFEAGGARYNWSVVCYQGVGELIDGLAAVRQAVYERRLIAPGELLAALKNDFAGREDLRQILLAAHKFGNDLAEVDEPAREVLGRAWRELLARPTPRGGRYLPSCIIFTSNLGAGKTVGALPDGRRAGAPLADSVGAVAGRDRRGPTALLVSVTRLPLALAAGTPVLNLRFERRTLADPAGRQAAADLLRTYFRSGGLQLQITAVSQAELQAAQARPEAYADLTVRVGGFSEYFVRLDPQLQECVIQRTAHAV